MEANWEGDPQFSNEPRHLFFLPAWRPKLIVQKAKKAANCAAAATSKVCTQVPVHANLFPTRRTLLALEKVRHKLESGSVWQIVERKEEKILFPPIH
jgi:hypothetical protein